MSQGLIKNNHFQLLPITTHSRVVAGNDYIRKEMRQTVQHLSPVGVLKQILKKQWQFIFLHLVMSALIIT